VPSLEAPEPAARLPAPSPGEEPAEPEPATGAEKVPAA
jgi:hypothetical protein